MLKSLLYGLFSNLLAWPAEEISPEEALEIAEARAEIEAGKGIKAEGVWRELGI